MYLVWLSAEFPLLLLLVDPTVPPSSVASVECIVDVGWNALNEAAKMLAFEFDV